MGKNKQEQEINCPYNQTLDKVFDYMEKNPDKKNGWALILIEKNDKTIKCITKNILYEQILNRENEFIAVRFFPFGYNEKLDEDVKNKTTGLKEITI
jgi:hypothetical protein